MASPHDDLEALLELASELEWVEASKFIRSETSFSLREAYGYVENRIPHQYPNSVCAQSVARRLEQEKQS